MSILIYRSLVKRLLAWLAQLQHGHGSRGDHSHVYRVLCPRRSSVPDEGVTRILATCPSPAHAVNQRTLVPNPSNSSHSSPLLDITFLGCTSWIGRARWSSLVSLATGHTDWCHALWACKSVNRYWPWLRANFKWPIYLRALWLLLRFALLGTKRRWIILLSLLLINEYLIKRFE